MGFPKAGVRFIVNAVLDRQHRVAGIYVGDPHQQPEKLGFIAASQSTNATILHLTVRRRDV